MLLQKEAVPSPYNFTTAHLEASILFLLLPVTSRPIKWRTLSLDASTTETLPNKKFQELFCQNFGQDDKVRKVTTHIFAVSIELSS